MKQKKHLRFQASENKLAEASGGRTVQASDNTVISLFSICRSDRNPNFRAVLEQHLEQAIIGVFFWFGFVSKG